MKNYEDEVIAIKVNCILSIFVVLCLFLTWVFANDYINNKLDFIGFIFTFILLLLFVIVFGYFIFANIINAKKNQKIAEEIMRNGIKISGKIIRIQRLEFNKFKGTIFKRAAFFRKEGVYGAKGREYTNYYFAVVRYKYGGKNHIIRTPSLNFSPEHILDKNVDVYIYDGKCYVDNIKKDIKKIEKIKKDNIKRNIFIIISFFITLLFFSFMIFLHALKIINGKFVFGILSIIMIMYAVITSIIYLKQEDKK